MDKDDFKAIILSTLLGSLVVLSAWWLLNFAVYLMEGTTIPMWSDFNSWVAGLLH